MEKTKLLIIFGGRSAEHSVSRVSAASVIDNLNSDKYDIIKVGITEDGRWFLTEAGTDSIKNGSWEQLKNTPASLSPDTKIKGLVLLNNDGSFSIIKIDVIFPVLHGANGEDGTVQGLFELSNIPYVGSGVSGSANCMDKAITKTILDGADIKQAKWAMFYADEFNENKEKVLGMLEKAFTYPIFIKPSNSGSSVGISKAKTREELTASIKTALQYDEKILAEEFIDGFEIEVAVLGNRKPVASVCGEVAPARDFYDYEAKYSDENSLLHIPARIDDKTAQKVRETAIKAYLAANCRGLSRVDFFVAKKGNEVILNEINTIPGFTSISMYPKLFEVCGIPYSQLLDNLIEFAYESKTHRRGFNG